MIILTKIGVYISRDQGRDHLNIIGVYISEDPGHDHLNEQKRVYSSGETLVMIILTNRPIH
jgi:hypothetical protein